MQCCVKPSSFRLAGHEPGYERLPEVGPGQQHVFHPHWSDGLPSGKCRGCTSPASPSCLHTCIAQGRTGLHASTAQALQFMPARHTQCSWYLHSSALTSAADPGQSKMLATQPNPTQASTCALCCWLQAGVQQAQSGLQHPAGAFVLDMAVPAPVAAHAGHTGVREGAQVGPGCPPLVWLTCLRVRIVSGLDAIGR